MNDASPAGPSDGPPDGSSASTRSDREAIDRVRKSRRKRKLKLLDQLLRDIDLIFYCELSVLYYME